MEAKEKAKELVDKFKDFAHGYRAEGYNRQLFENAKQCALIAVEEILEELDKLRKPEYTTFILRYASHKKGTTEIEDEGESCDGYELIYFWRQVKEEIIKQQ